MDHTIGTCYQNPAHPQNYALTDNMITDNMRGNPPPQYGEILQENGSKGARLDGRGHYSMSGCLFRGTEGRTKPQSAHRSLVEEMAAGVSSSSETFSTPILVDHVVSMANPGLRARQKGVCG